MRNLSLLYKETELKTAHIKYIIFSVLVFLLFSCKTASLSDARKQFLSGEYFAASETYRNVYRNLKPDQRAMRGVVSFEMAEAYRKLNMPMRASNSYANAIRYNYPDTLMHLRYAQMLHREGKYKDALDAYEYFLKSDSANYMAQAGVAGVMLAEELRNNPTRHQVYSMTIFNSNRSEFSPMLAKDDSELYFTSARSAVSKDSVSDITGMKDNDLFLSVKNDKGEWQRPQKIASEINTKFDEGTPSISSDGRLLYYTFSPVLYDRPSNPKIYFSQRGAESWNAGVELTIVEGDSLSLFAHPAISPSGDWLYFVSDMPGGYGGKDIWRAAMRGGKALYYENMGPDINTPGDEMFPYAASDSVLYFSSDGLPGMGGLDLFEAQLAPSGLHWQVENMGYPVNSSMDDFGITFESNGRNGFYSSNRGDMRGRDHIYRFEYPETVVQIEGFVIDQDENFIPNAKIDLIGSDGVQQELTVNKQGTYRFIPKLGQRYVLMAHADGFLNQRKATDISTEEKDSTYYIDFKLIPYNIPVVLDNIFYDFDRATLRDESKAELDSLVNMLNEYPDIVIELSAHTDRKGSNEYNQNLSQRRAQSVIDYLVESGIQKKRLQAVGYGKLAPKVVTRIMAEEYEFLHEGDILTEEFIDGLLPEEQDVADQINRRTEFKVIDPTFGLN